MGLTVAAAVQNSRIIVTVTSSPSITAPLTVLRVHPDGSSHAVLSPDVTPYLIGGSAAMADYHAPLNQRVTYSATAGAQTGTSAKVVQLGAKTRLSHPDNADLTFVPESIRAVADRDYDSPAVGFPILDRVLPVHDRDAPRSGESGTLVVNVGTRAKETALRALLADGGPLLVNGLLRDLGWLWIQPGKVTWSNPAGFDGYPTRWVTIPYQATTQPDTAGDPVFTCDDLAATGWTCAQAATHYADCNGMALDIRIA